MGFESPTPHNKHPFDSILENLDSQQKRHSETVNIDNTQCDVHWHESNPNEWTVYIEGKPIGVTRISDGTFSATNGGKDELTAHRDTDLKQSAIEAVEVILKKQHQTLN